MHILQAVSGSPMMTIPIDPAQSKITSAIWGPHDEFILTGHENGEINQFDIKVILPVKHMHKK